MPISPALSTPSSTHTRRKSSLALKRSPLSSTSPGPRSPALRRTGAGGGDDEDDGDGDDFGDDFDDFEEGGDDDGDFGDFDDSFQQAEGNALDPNPAPAYAPVPVVAPAPAPTPAAPPASSLSFVRAMPIEASLPTYSLHGLVDKAEHLPLL